MLWRSAAKMQALSNQNYVCVSAIGLVLILTATAGCTKPATLGEGKPTLRLTSSSFQGGNTPTTIPKKFTCDGANVSPELAWAAPPAGTQSFALIAVDRDTLLSSFTGYQFTHWVVYDVPAAARELPENVPNQAQLPDGSRQGQNDFGKPGYGGPCPHWTSHRYVFTLYALDSELNLPAESTRQQVEDALKPHILARGELTGAYHR